MSIFENAVRLKLRFETPQGLISVEDLWDLPLTSKTGRANLDDIARFINKKLKSDDDVSFVVAERKTNPVEQLRFDVVKHVIDTKITENTIAANKKAASEKNQKILSIIAEKEEDSLKSMPIEELRKLIGA